MKPCTDFHRAGSRADREAGERLLREGAMACLILAGGQGTRLGFEGPKGLFPLGQTCLFDIFSKQLARWPVPTAVMVSPRNHAATAAHFAGSDVELFEQGMLPFLDEEGNELEVWGPNGNGGALRSLRAAGILGAWRDRGVRYINVLPVDNALADPCDAELLGFGARMGADLVVKCTQREGAEKNVGVLAEGPSVIEYSEASMGAEFDLVNLNLFLLDIQFAEQMADAELPLHHARKRVPELGSVATKQELFLFDILPLAKRVEVIVYPRNGCFAPLKERADVEKIAASGILDKTL